VASWAGDLSGADPTDFELRRTEFLLRVAVDLIHQLADKLIS
jgi:hypothetical protein